MPTALITGASYGLGAEYAQALAQKQFNLVLVARSQAKLEQLAQDLQQKHAIQVLTIAQDLTEFDAVDQILAQVKAQNWSIDWLINNAGFGDYGPFAETDRQKQQKMIQLNIATLVDMTHQVLPEMIARRSGVILNLASIAAFQPLPYLSVYAASKTFVLHFSEALWAENRDKGILVMAVCPGPTQTQFFEVAGFDPRMRGNSPNGVATPQSVVEETLQAIEHKNSVLVTGFANKVLTNLPRFVPRDWLVQMVSTQFRPPQ